MCIFVLVAEDYGDLTKNGDGIYGKDRSQRYRNIGNYDKNDDYISLTEILKAKDGDFFISDWLRNWNTIEFLGIWEEIYNPKFNYGEFAIIKSHAGLNNYKISVKEWVEKTGAVGLKVTIGRSGAIWPESTTEFILTLSRKT